MKTASLSRKLTARSQLLKNKQTKKKQKKNKMQHETRILLDFIIRFWKSITKKNKEKQYYSIFSTEFLTNIHSSI
jgi:hypothetical protein